MNLNRMVPGFTRVTAMLAACLLVVSAALKAEDTPPPSPADEAAEAAAEEKAENALTETGKIAAFKQFSGKLILNGDDGGDDNDGVIGTLIQETGKSYLLKLTDKKVMKDLTPRNNKVVQLTGKLRNRDKYLIVTSVNDPSGGAAPDRKKRGGI